METRQATAELVDFAQQTTYAAIPSEVVNVGRTLLIDTIGCALGGHGVTKGRTAVEAGADFGEGNAVTVLGAGRASVLGGSFANGELANALDMDSILRLSHVTPYVLPPTLVGAELGGSSGMDLIRGIVLAHEVAARVAGAFTSLRTNTASGERLAAVTGYGPMIVGGVVGAGLPLGLDRTQLLNAVGVAAYMAPVPALGKYLRTGYGPTAKYTSAGWLTVGAVLAARLVARGYTGDREALDGDYGLWRMSASSECDWDFMLNDLGTTWHVEQAEIKPYPSFRMGHPGVEAFISLLAAEHLELSDIDEVVVEVDPVAASPIFLNTDVTDSDSYISWAHVLGAAALYPPGPAWHSTAALSDPRIKKFMAKVSVRPDQTISSRHSSGSNPVSRPVSVVVRRGSRSYVAEPMPLPKGHPLRKLSAEEFDEKFLRNAAECLEPIAAEKLLALLKSVTELSDLSEMFVALGGNQPSTR